MDTRPLKLGDYDQGKGGGYVLSTVHNIQEQVPPENIVAMFEACLSFRNRATDSKASPMIIGEDV